MVCEGVVVRQENLQIDKVLKPKPVGWAAAVVWALVAQPTRQASLWRVHEGVVVRQEDVQINKVLNLTAVGCGTALAWAPVARLVTQASLEVVEEGVAHEGAVRERVVQEGVVQQEGVEDVRLDKALKPTAAGWVTASVWAPVVT
ncbi:hypothetical protein PF010_g27768 [Phytophthora fragariae]|uniref:Uncharacterized protein n=1 Tax=Phytophthora fragariae TaxID=53985 RepID=A0A6G0JTT9_9STRA|nr:hypothetical protein PF010_g27768 [Phytophthora fragariae]